jgi:LCP family protein required for cell wall assembly
MTKGTIYMRMENNDKTPKWKIALLVFESVVVLLYAVMTVFFVWYKVDRNSFIASCSANPLVRMLLNYSAGDDYEKNVQDTSYNKENVKQNEGLTDNIETYRNIALFGIDSRGSEFDDSTHSDTIIIVSINNKTGEVKMASVYRDTMLKIVDEDGDISYTKANAAFFKGGPECAINMLNTNLDLNITDYAVVNFTGLTKIIDALGGVDVNITEDEQYYINGYLTETRKITGLDTPDVSASGNVHLTGLQATAYCRIRYVTFYDEDGTSYYYDMGRTARQRLIIKKVVEKAKSAGVSQVLDIANSILHYNTEDEKIITTSLSFDEVMDLIPTLINFTLSDSTGFPFTCDTPTINGASMVVAQGLEYNVEKLHQFLFEAEDYETTDTVKTISDYLINYTGIPTVKLDEDKSDDDYGYSYDDYDDSYTNSYDTYDN